MENLDSEATASAHYYIDDGDHESIISNVNANINNAVLRQPDTDSRVIWVRLPNNVPISQLRDYESNDKFKQRSKPLGITI